MGKRPRPVTYLRKKDAEAVRRARVRQLFEAGLYERTEIGIFKFQGWLHKHRSELLPKRTGDAYQHLKSDLSGLLQVAMPNQISCGPRDEKTTRGGHIVTRERYSQWMAVWKWFQRQKGSSELAGLYDMLNDMWQEDRQSSTPEQIENDPELQKFLQDLDRAFAKDSEPIRVARVRQLFQIHHPGNPTGTAVLVFLEWLRQQHPDLLPKEKPYQHLKVDLSGLYVD